MTSYSNVIKILNIVQGICAILAIISYGFAAYFDNSYLYTIGNILLPITLYAFVNKWIFVIIKGSP